MKKYNDNFIQTLHLVKKYWYLSAFILILLIIIFVVKILPFVLPETHVKNGEVYGVLFNNQVWEGEIKVVGDVYSMPDTKVTIQPGTRVVISKSGDKSNLILYSWYLKNGINIGEADRSVGANEPFWDEREKVQLRLSNVYAVGNKDNPITFTSNNFPGSRYDINVIEFNQGEVDYAQFSHYRRLEVGRQFKISHSIFENTADCSLCLSYGKQIVKSNEFKNGLKNYITADFSSARIEDNRFLPSLADGILFMGNNESNIVLTNNFFDQQQKKSVKVLSSDEGGIISGNIFNAGEIELPCNSNVEMTNNLIKVQVIFKDTGGCVGEYTFGSNYWEIFNSQDIIQARIVGETSQFKVNIPNFFKKPTI